MRAHFERWLPHFFFCVGIGFILAAAYAYFAPLPGSALDVAETEVEISDGVPGLKREIVFRFDNRSGKPMRVLGLSGC